MSTLHLVQDLEKNKKIFEEKKGMEIQLTFTSSNTG
jgi:hypothetical protein